MQYLILLFLAGYTGGYSNKCLSGFKIVFTYTISCHSKYVICSKSTKSAADCFVVPPRNDGGGANKDTTNVLNEEQKVQECDPAEKAGRAAQCFIETPLLVTKKYYRK